jgi:hypothetical protein
MYVQDGSPKLQQRTKDLVGGSLTTDGPTQLQRVNRELDTPPMLSVRSFRDAGPPPLEARAAADEGPPPLHKQPSQTATTTTTMLAATPSSTSDSNSNNNNKDNDNNMTSSSQSKAVAIGHNTPGGSLHLSANGSQSGSLTSSDRARLLAGPVNEMTAALRRHQKEQGSLRKSLRKAQSTAAKADEDVSNQKMEVEERREYNAEAEAAAQAARNTAASCGTPIVLMYHNRKVSNADKTLRKAERKLGRLQNFVERMAKEVANLNAALGKMKVQIDETKATIVQMAGSVGDGEDVDPASVNPYYRERLREFDDLSLFDA